MPSKSSIAISSRRFTFLRTRGWRQRLVQCRHFTIPAALFLAFSILYGCHSTIRHIHFETGGYDLGIFEQAIARYSRMEAPRSELKGTNVNLLGDHFHPIIATIAPFYRLFPSPLTLLWAQAVLLAASVVILHSATAVLLPRRPALGLAIAYGLSWGIAGAVAYDFHEVVFAVPIIALALRGLVLQRPGQAAGWILLLILVKEEMGASVAAFGILLFISGARRLGVCLTAAGTAAFCLIVGYVVPLLSATGKFAYWRQVHVYDSDASKTSLPDIITGAVVPQKLGGLVIVFLPVAFLAVFSRFALLTIPTLAWHLLASNPDYSGTKYHYGVMLMPIVHLAAADVLSRLSLRESVIRRMPRIITVGVGATAAVTLAIAVNGPFTRMMNPSWWHVNSDDRDAAHALATVPLRATVAAHNRLAAHLTTDRTVFQLNARLLDEFGRPVDVDYVIAEITKGTFPIPANERRQLLASLQGCGYKQIYSHRGYVTLRRTGNAPRGWSLTRCIEAGLPPGKRSRPW